MTQHCGQTSSGATNVITVPAINYGTVVPNTGTLKGVMVSMHQLGAPISTYPAPTVDVGGILPSRPLTLCNTIAATGWYCINPVLPGDAANPGGQRQLIYDDMNTDTGHGTRWVATIGEWWDHLVWSIQRNISASVPIVALGGSGGGFHALQIGLTRTSTIAGFIGHHPASIWSDLNPTFTGISFDSLNTTGANIGATGLNGIKSIPFLLGWGSIDAAIGPSPWTGDLLTPAIFSAALTAGCPVSANCDGTGTSLAGTGPGQIQENHVLTDSTDNANPYNDVAQIAAWFHTNLPHN